MPYFPHETCCPDPVASAAAIPDEANCSWLHQSHHCDTETLAAISSLCRSNPKCQFCCFDKITFCRCYKIGIFVAMTIGYVEGCQICTSWSWNLSHERTYHWNIDLRILSYSTSSGDQAMYSHHGVVVVAYNMFFVDIVFRLFHFDNTAQLNCISIMSHTLYKSPTV